MKVLHTPGEGWKKNATCRHCKTRVELALEDLRYVDDQRDGAAVVWRCPTCKNEIYVTATFVPEHLHHKLRSS